MENHKVLYKANSTVLSPQNHSEINRERQRLARSKRRDECFQKNRNIRISPMPSEKLSAPMRNKISLKDSKMIAEKENQEVIPLSTDQNIIISKSLRHDNYLQRFLKWKQTTKMLASKKRELKTQTHSTTDTFVPPKRRSLYAVVDSNTVRATVNKQTDTVRSKIDSGNKQTNAVKPKVISKAPLQLAISSANTVNPTATVGIKSTVNIKTLVPNNGVKQKLAACTTTMKHYTNPNIAGGKLKPSGTAAESKPSGTNAAGAVNAVKVKIPATTSTVVKSKASKATVADTAALVKPKVANSAASRNFVLTAGVKSKPAGKSVVAPTTKVTKPIKEMNEVVGCGPSVSAAGNVKVVFRPPNLRTQPFEKPVISNNIVKPIRGGGVAAKFKAKNTINSAKTNAAPHLAMCMKAKKPASNKQKLINQVPTIKQELLQATFDELTPDTPLDVISNPFQMQVTSTVYKTSNSGVNLLSEACGDLSIISPLTSNDNRKALDSSAKRKLLPAKDAEQPTRKFNFVRYSEANSLIESPVATESQCTLKPGISDDNNDKEITLLPQTPPPNPESKPNYLSPFVSVSRGKVNSRSEREKRNSMYLQNEGEEKAETPVAVRRTLESVLYFRLQLDNEIKRLHLLCDTWQLYVAQNEEHLQTTGGKDMIDAAIGQTKLLTSKKLMQFKTLIDRCESGVTGVGLAQTDGSEATKPVLAEDLEGWWDMMRLQGENIDKRFDNLERWKANNWQDPHTQPIPKCTEKILPKNKTKAKPAIAASSSIRNFLRKAYAEKRKNEISEAPKEDSNQLNTTPKRRSHRIIVVRDRKSFSPARTVLRVSIGNGNRPSISKTLLKSAIQGAVEEKSRQQVTPPPKSRMSILKTPGTAKRETGVRGVIFSAKKKVRLFQFTYDEGNISGDENSVKGVDNMEDCELDMSLEKSSSQCDGQQANNKTSTGTEVGNVSRSYGLRNRKVKLRPSSEFM